MQKVKLIEKILTNKEYCEKIIEMTFEEFEAELARLGVQVKDAEMIYNTVKTAAAGGNVADDDLEAVTGGRIACSCDPETSSNMDC